MGGDEHDISWLQGQVGMGGTDQQVLICIPCSLGKTVIKASSSKTVDNYNPTEKN